MAVATVDEKDMVEIDLESPPVNNTKLRNSMGNREVINSKFDCSNFCTRHRHSVDCDDRLQWQGVYKLEENNCVRQLYCPDCQNRLDVEAVHHKKLLSCCFMLFPLQRWLKSMANRKVTCTKCGNDFGYPKRN